MKRIKENYFDEKTMKKADTLASDYFKSSSSSIAKKDKQMKRGDLVLFDRGFEVIVVTIKHRDFVAQYIEV